MAACEDHFQCTNKLCQFKHTESLENENGKAEDITIEMKSKFKKLSEIEQLESKELLCDIYCKASFGYHICTNDDFEDFIGCDILNIVDEYINDEDGDEILGMAFPCRKCDERFHDIEILKKHFDTKHNGDNQMQCRIDKCKFSGNTIELIKMHLGIDHFEEVSRRM